MNAKIFQLFGKKSDDDENDDGAKRLCFFFTYADTNSDDYGAVTLDVAFSILKGYDWEPQIKLFDELSENGIPNIDYTIPTITFIPENDLHLLKFCPHEDGSYMCLFWEEGFTEVVAFLQWRADKVRAELQYEFLHLFYEEDYDGIMNQMYKDELVYEDMRNE